MKKGYPFPLGVSEKECDINFSVAVPSGQECILKLYKKGKQDPELEFVLSEEGAIGEVRFLALPKTQVKSMEYHYVIDGKICVDPYAKSVIEVDGVHTRGRISLEKYDWEGDKPLEIPYHKVVSYNLHVRGFTKHSSSKVKKKGTFQGVVEKLPYLKELGINQIQCMPVYSYEESRYYKNYWGYGEAFCFAVKNSYAAGKSAEKELKDMVKACHREGIEVILYLPFTDNTPKPLILECLRYYAMEYHVDGFVLNPYVAPMESIYTDSYLKRTKILQNRDDFQTIMRRFLRGDEGVVEGVIEWMKKSTKESGSCNYITRHTGFTLADLVSYSEKHNEDNGERNEDGPSENYSWNCGKEGPTNEEDICVLRRRQVRNAFFLLMMAQGTPCILAGDEFGNTQDGNNNVYCQDNEVGWLGWGELQNNHTLFEYVKGLVGLRKSMPFLHTNDDFFNQDVKDGGVPSISYHGDNAWVAPTHSKSKKLGIYYHNAEGDVTDCLIAYNMDEKEVGFAFPKLPKEKKWYRVFTTANETFQMEDEVETNQKLTKLGSRTIAMFIGR